MRADLPPPSRERNFGAELDSLLGVASWSTPSREGIFAPVDEIPDGAPAWWFGDEEASQSFLAAQGVQL
jgi:hypothetical protein